MLQNCTTIKWDFCIVLCKLCETLKPLRENFPNWQKVVISTDFENSMHSMLYKETSLGSKRMNPFSNINKQIFNFRIFFSNSFNFRFQEAISIWQQHQFQFLISQVPTAFFICQAIKNIYDLTCKTLSWPNVRTLKCDYTCSSSNNTKIMFIILKFRRKQTNWLALRKLKIYKILMEVNITIHFHWNLKSKCKRRIKDMKLKKYLL